MGGWGSGGSWGFGKRKCEEALRLDIRSIKRRDCLIPGKRFTWQWTWHDNTQSSIGIKVHNRYVILNYTHQGEPVKQQIPFEWTPCHYGGKRAWWRCPHCGRRCALLHAPGKYFSCRVCHGLVYRTTCESAHERKFTKANNLRVKIGADAGAFNRLSYEKPKYMHWKTWDRIMGEIRELEHQALMEVGRMMGMNV